MQRQNPVQPFFDRLLFCLAVAQVVLAAAQVVLTPMGSSWRKVRSFPGHLSAGVRCTSPVPGMSPEVERQVVVYILVRCASMSADKSQRLTAHPGCCVVAVVRLWEEAPYCMSRRPAICTGRQRLTH
ncbi:hypothetical protein KVR01_011174 [Diaporthe batatas]|uniref:uncharacterized protein n=1 Tax=Diaporthe batatas TaxID=748121 RepID=UPI001D03BEED|nr:uncharacterized protein KVR01_011174 [Diaporthe batatas]KAG8158731.1 hypothetical protein KVR01_011174 [Diaporthe batatas]